MTVENIVALADALPPAERRELIKQLVDTLTVSNLEPKARPRSIMELEGLGKDIWQGVDVQAYLNEMRDEWDRHK